jgi:phage gp29-like protein
MSKRRRDFETLSPDKKTTSGHEARGELLIDDFSEGNQFATRRRANDFLHLLRTLPDPDPILRKMGRDITALGELLTDSHLESVWSVRCSATSGAEWFCSAGGEGKTAKEKEAAEVFAEQLGNLDIPRVIEEMMDAAAYGYSPLEVLWTRDGEKWGISDIVGKPPQWFEFDQDNRLVFRTGVAGTEELPPNRFLLARHRPSYANPYGVKVFSKCYWPVTFKKNGFRWWTVFVEKYGGAFLYGKYPNNAGEQYKADMLSALKEMIADAVAIVPEDAAITIESAKEKGAAGSVHADYIKMANAEISKAVLGQTLTTEIGDKGSYAAAATHNLVREDLAASDRRRICELFNKLSAVWTLYNFGAEAAPPQFQFVKDEDLQTERAERDVKLYAVGWRPTKTYMMKQYELEEDDFDFEKASANSFTARPPNFPHGVGCNCGRDDNQNVFEKIAALFASKGDRLAARDTKLMREFSGLMKRRGQKAIDGNIKAYADALGTVETFEDAREALLSAYGKNSLEDFAAVIDEVRFAAQGIGGRRAGR